MGRVLRLRSMVTEPQARTDGWSPQPSVRSARLAEITGYRHDLAKEPALSSCVLQRVV